MKAPNKEGRMMEIWIQGTFDDPRVQDASFEDAKDDLDVPTDEDLDYVFDKYALQVEEEILDYQIGMADAIHDRMKEEGY